MAKELNETNMEQKRLTFTRLADWIDGRLSPTEAASVAAQLAVADAETQAAAAWLQQFRALRQTVQLISPPAGLQAELRAQFANRADNPFRQFIAALSFDSYTETAVAGIRSAAQEASRQFIYTTDTADVVLTIQAAQPTPVLMLGGQIFPNSDETTETVAVQLVQQHQEQAIAVCNELGEFFFPAINPGAYDIICSSAAFELILPRVLLQI